MSSAGIFRAAAILARATPSRSVFVSRSSISTPMLRTSRNLVNTGCLSKRAFGSTVGRWAEHKEETFEEFNARFENEFNGVNDVFELQRNLNNAFAFDLVPSPAVVVAALRAARRVNDFPTAVRIFEGIKEKVENHTQYEEYLKELEPIRQELGIPLKETMYPD